MRLHINWRALTMVGALVVIWIAFSIATEGTFLTPRNLSLLARQMAVTALLAIGMVMVIVAGQIDLSVGALAGLMGAISAMMFTNRHWPLAAAFLLALVAGTALGLLQGNLVAWLRIPPFIVTLGGMLIFQGVLLGVTGGVSTSPTRAYLYVGQSYVPKMLGWIGAGLIAAFFLYRTVRDKGAEPAARVRAIGRQSDWKVNGWCGLSTCAKPNTGPGILGTWATAARVRTVDRPEFMWRES